MRAPSMPPIGPTPPTPATPNPLTMQTTLAHFSAYAFPNSKQYADDSPLPLGVLVSPAARLQPPPPSIEHSPLRCGTCGAYLSLHCRVDAASWTCSICAARNAAELPPLLPELSKKVVDYSLAPAATTATATTPSYVLVVDAEAPKSALADLRRSLATVLADMPPGSLYGLVSFSNTVGVYSFDTTSLASDLASCNAARGHCVPSGSELEHLLSGRTLTDDAAALLRCVEALESSARDADDSADKLMKPRCLGPAIWVAAEVAGRASHVVVLTTGPPDYGPGSVTPAPGEEPAERERAARAFYEGLGASAAARACTVSVFCAGMRSFAVPLMRAVAAPTGGSVVVHKRFDSTFAHDLWLLLFRACGSGGTLEVRAPASVAVSRVIGGVTSLERRPPAATAMALAAVHPDEAVSVYFRLADDVPEDYVHVQFALTYTDLQQGRVTRVVSRRVRTTGSAAAYAQSVDVRVAAVLMLKRSVLMASKPDIPAAAVLRDLDEQLRQVARRHGPDLPPHLARLPSVVYHARRGPLLGPILQHADDMDAVRSLFLGSGLEDSLRMAAPRLLSFDRAGQFEELPPETLALQSGRVLMLDHHTHVFVWSGRAVTGPEFDVYRDACRDRAAEESRLRVPCPEVLFFAEGESAARWLECRLNPSHRDPEAEQLRGFPQLLGLGADELAALRAKFLPTDDASEREWWLGLVSKSTR